MLLLVGGGAGGLPFAGDAEDLIDGAATHGLQLSPAARGVSGKVCSSGAADFIDGVRLPGPRSMYQVGLGAVLDTRNQSANRSADQFTRRDVLKDGLMGRLLTKKREWYSQGAGR